MARGIIRAAACRAVDPRCRSRASPGQYGIAIAGGRHIQILDNKVFGKKQPFTNVGIYVWNQSKAPSKAHTEKGNMVKWLNKSGIENPCWDAKNCGTVTGWDDND
jgi:hypothetical protein